MSPKRLGSTSSELNFRNSLSIVTSPMKLPAKFKPELAAISIIIIFFTLFFWPATLAGRLFVTGDAIVYSYPLRTIAWDALRRGELPLWTPALLGGYPLLSMAQLGLGYPLTWGYLFLPGYAAEQIYVLAPFLLAPLFTYAFAREIGRSRLASLLAGLSFGYGGMMASGMAHNGKYTNAVVWLPLMLIAIERARTRRLLPCLIGASAAYAMSVLSGLGQGFVYAGVMALLYATFLSAAPIEDNGKAARGWRRLADWRSWKPLVVCVGGMALAVGVAAFQIFETRLAQRLSIRREISYEIFSGGSFTLAEAWRSFVAPLYHYNYEVSTYLSPLAALAALAAVIAAVRAPRANLRIIFWLGLAALSLLLMLGGHTPLYRLAYHLPVVNLFRIPWRHAFEWTFAVAILSAYGWDAVATVFFKRDKAMPRAINNLIGGALFIACLVAGCALFKLAVQPEERMVVPQQEWLPETVWLLWKAGYTALLLLTVWWGARRLAPAWRGAFLAAMIALTCFWEPQVMLSNWWFRQAKPAAYFNQVSPPSQFLQSYPPEQSRIYTSIANGFILDLPRAEPHNLSVRRGFHDAAGYEPLMLERYSRAFGIGWAFDTPAFSSPRDKQVLDPRWQTLDLLNVRFLAEFAAPSQAWTEKDGARFAAGEAQVVLPPAAAIILTGAAAKVDSLSLVTELANSIAVADGEVVAKVIIRFADGREVTRDLKAGRDTSEWAHERADVRPNIRHSLARVFDSRQGDGFSAHRYWARIDLGGKSAVDRVSISSTLKEASLILWKATLYDSAGDGATLLTQGLPDHWRKVYDHDNARIYENPRLLPRAWLVPKAELVNAEEALRRIRGEGESFDPRKTALIEPGDKVKIALPQGEFEGNAEARIVGYRPNQLVIETEAGKRAALVVSEMNYPGWEATVDGQPATIFPTNYLLRGVIVPEGRHRVEMRYPAPAARLGTGVSALSLLFILGAGLLQLRQRRSSSDLKPKT
jgi:hypothetical protein